MLATEMKIQLRPQQQLPEGNDWNIWVVCAGRGFGKTLTGAAAVNTLMSSGKYKHVALIGATLFDVRNVMVEGISGLMSINHNLHYSVYNRTLTWQNQGEGVCFGGEHHNKLRGYQFDLVWIDEFAKINQVHHLWDQINFCLRLGPNAKIIITTTPRNLQVLKDIIALPHTILTKGSSYDNKENLSKIFFQNIQQYEDSFLGKQEIYGQIINDNYLWRGHEIKHIHENYIGNNPIRTEIMDIQQRTDSHYHNPFNPDNSCQNIQNNGGNNNVTENNKIPNINTRINFLCPNKDIEEYVIGVDPAFGGDNETGIILAAITHSQKYIILDDFSGSYKPEIWIDIIKQIAIKLNATIAIEINHGGNIFLDLFKGFRVVEERAYTDKYTRSMPCYLMYHNKEVLHNYPMVCLENQMCNLQRGKDRVDALVWALYYLKNRYDKYISLLKENIFIC